MQLKLQAAYEFQTVQICNLKNIFEPRYDKTNKMSLCPAKTQMILDFRPVYAFSG